MVWVQFLAWGRNGLRELEEPLHVAVPELAPEAALTRGCRMVQAVAWAPNLVMRELAPEAPLAPGCRTVQVVAWVPNLEVEVLALEAASVQGCRTVQVVAWVSSLVVGGLAAMRHTVAQTAASALDFRSLA
jgi:hypothetical protein